jgi:uncharacterized protein YbcI
MVDRGARARGQTLTEISNAMVALHREHFGRGPGAAKSVMVDDMIVCTLTDIYTAVEKTLIRAGNIDRVRDTRQLHQIALEREFVAPVEQITGRRVDAFISSVHFDPDIAVEMFLLAPQG